MQHPSAKPAMLVNRFLDSVPLCGGQHDRLLTHNARRDTSKALIGTADHTAIIDPSSRVAGQPRAVSRPRQKERQWFKPVN
jgi:hypothetical protein